MNNVSQAAVCRWLLGLALAAAFSAAAEPAPVFTMEDCLRSGLAKDIRVANARREQQAADARYRQYRARILPEVTARGAYQRQDEIATFDFGGATLPMGRLDNYSASVEVRQLIYDGGAVQAGLRAADVYRARAAHALRQAEADRARDIRLAFHAMLFAREAVGVEERRMEQLERFVADAEARFRQEALSEFDLMSARVRLANARPDLIRARRDLQLARAALRNLAWLDADDFDISGEWTFDPRLPDLPAAQTVAVHNRPEAQQLRQTVGLAEADLRAEKGTYSPVFRARAGYAGQNPPGFGSSENDWEWHWSVGLTVEWTMFDGLSRPNRIREKRLVYDQTAAALADLEREIALEVERAHLALCHATEAAAAARENVALADRAVEIARVRFNAGLSTRLEFIESSVAAAVARLNWFGALRAQRDARALLEWACGGPLDRLPPAAGAPAP